MLFFLSITILILASGLLITSGLGLVLDLEIFQLEKWQAFGGGGLLLLSFLLAVLNLLTTGHPLYEYWFVVLVASMIAVCYI